MIVYYGSADGLLPANWERFGQEVSEAGVESGDRFGSALAAGDFNGDGKDDLAVGMPGENFGGATETGIVEVLWFEERATASKLGATGPETGWWP